MVTPAHPAHHAGMASGGREGTTLRGFFGVFRYSRRALELVWSTNRALTLALALLTLIAGILPASVAYVGALIVDAVVAAIRAGGGVATRVAQLVVLEGMLVAAIAAAQRGLSLCQSLLRAQLGQRVNVMILEKALTLELQHFEDSEFYDKLTRARREASTRPLSLVTRTFGLVQNGISLVSYGVLLARFSPWAVAVFLLALARDAHADLPRDRDRPRGSRQGGQALRPGSAAARALPRHLPAAVPRGSLAHHAPRCLGLWPGAHRHRGALRRLRLDRGQRRAPGHHARPDDHERRAVSPGTGGRVRHAGGGRRHVRGQPVPVDALRVPGNQCAGAGRHRGARSTSGRWRALRGRELHLPGSRGSGPRARHTAPDPRRQSRPGGRERLGENHPDQVADTPVRTHLGKDPARRAGPRAMGRERAAREDRRHLPGLCPLSDAGR